nr:hypothetical protein [Nitrosomonas aestuarii]
MIFFIDLHELQRASNFSSQNPHITARHRINAPAIAKIAKNNDSIPILRPDRKQSVVVIITALYRFLMRFNCRLPFGRIGQLVIIYRLPGWPSGPMTGGLD